MNTISHYILLALLALCPASGFCQQTEERLIVKDAPDSLLVKAFRTSFDTAGNYYFETPLGGKEDKFSLTTAKKKYPAVYWGKTIGTVPYKSFVADAFFSDTSHKKVYYKNKLGTVIYGPHAGRVREVLEFGRDNIAIELCTGDKSHLYINDSLVCTTDSLLMKWLCYFSDNGHVIYSTVKDGVYGLYVDHKRIDTSRLPFTDMAINNNRFYTYVKQVNGKFYAHTPDKTYGPFGAVDGGDLWNNGAWYYRGCADSSCYVLVNGQLFANIAESHANVEDQTGSTVYKSDEQITVELKDRNNFLFSYNQNNEDGIYINANGKVSKYDYVRTGYIFNTAAGYAFYGSRQDSMGVEHTYKNENGTEKKLPAFKKGTASAQCLQLDASGNSLYYYNTQDSIYLFRNDTLLCQPASRKKFLTFGAEALPQNHANGTEFFMGFNITNECFIMYNNTLSRPMPLVKPEYDRLDAPHKGTVVAGDLTPDGFFIIVYMGQGKYLLNINNTVYRDLEGIDRIFGEQSFFSAGKLVFYGVKGNAFYEYMVRF